VTADIGTRVGRAWTKKELRIKSLSDVHVLWWKCHLELNRLATEAEERTRLEPGYGKYELDKRRDTVCTRPSTSSTFFRANRTGELNKLANLPRCTQLKDTQKAIREALQERYEAWQEAKDIINADQDPDVTVNAEGQPVWRQDADPYEIDEMDGKIEPMTNSRVALPEQRAPSV
jgi:large subunit ribosomal protein L47